MAQEQKSSDLLDLFLFADDTTLLYSHQIKSSNAWKSCELWVKKCTVISGRLPAGNVFALIFQ